MSEVEKLLDRMQAQEQRHYQELAHISSLVLSVDQALAQALSQERPDLMHACIAEAREQINGYVQKWKVSALPSGTDVGTDPDTPDTSASVHPQPQRAPDTPAQQ